MVAAEDFVNGPIEHLGAMGGDETFGDIEDVVSKDVLEVEQFLVGGEF